MKVLVTGGAGYIGSHTVVELVAAGHDAVIVDNLSNSKHGAVERIEQLVDRDIPFYELDVRDQDGLDKIFDEHEFDAVIHFAALKAVGESVEKPLEYYDNNLVSSLRLLETMRAHEVRTLIFSSSATVYGNPDKMPLTEDQNPYNGESPYGWTKVMIEQILRDLAKSDDQWRITLLRYFNPIGSHSSGQIGEDAADVPPNLLPYVLKVAAGQLERLNVFGDDYDTPDGTNIRDYIHVVDLAKGHVKALEHAPKPGEAAVYNLGTGQGTSVLEFIKAFEQATGQKIPYKITGRRPGDIVVSYADPSKAERELGWKTELTIEDALKDAWKWQEQNPRGYSS